MCANRDWHGWVFWPQVATGVRLLQTASRGRWEDKEGVQVQMGAMAIANRFVVFTWPQQTEPCKSIGTLGDTWQLHLGRVFCGSAAVNAADRIGQGGLDHVWLPAFQMPFATTTPPSLTHPATWIRLLVGIAYAAPDHIHAVRSGTTLVVDAARPGRWDSWPPLLLLLVPLLHCLRRRCRPTPQQGVLLGWGWAWRGSNCAVGRELKWESRKVIIRAQKKNVARYMYISRRILNI